MKAGTVVAIVLGVAGAGAVTYYFWQRKKGSDAAASMASGQTLTPSQVAIQASLSGKKLSTQPTALPADFNATVYYRLNPRVKEHGWLASAHYMEYGWREGRRWIDDGQPPTLTGIPRLGFLIQ